MGKEVGISENHIFFQFLDDQNSKLNTIFIVSTVIFLIISFVGSLLLSHKVAGPIYRMTQYLKQYQNEFSGSELQFRKVIFL